MHNHRIVPEGTEISLGNDDGFETAFYPEDDTIPMPSEWTAEELVVLAGITRSEWDEINIDHRKKYRNCVDYPFSQYLSDLISLTPLKGLTVEEIRKLNEVKK